MNHNKLWKILQEMGTLDHFTCLMRNLYAGQEAKVTTGYGTMEWFQIGKGICQGCILKGMSRDDRGWDGWLASLTRWTWVWAALGRVGDGQGCLACCSPWSCKQLVKPIQIYICLDLDIKMLRILTQVINILSPDTYLSHVWNLNEKFSMTRTAF